MLLNLDPQLVLNAWEDFGHDPFGEAGFPNAFDLDLSGVEAGLKGGNYYSEFGQPPPYVPVGVKPQYSFSVPSEVPPYQGSGGFEGWQPGYAVNYSVPPPINVKVETDHEPADELAYSPCSVSSHDVAVVPDFCAQTSSSAASNFNSNTVIVPQTSATSGLLPPVAPLVMDVVSSGEPEVVRTREECLARYKEKKSRRLYTKKIRYHLRKINADKRPRIKGRFVKKEELADYIRCNGSVDYDGCINFITGCREENPELNMNLNEFP